MSVDKKIDYVNQDGYKNYIKNSKSVTVPVKFKSKQDATPTKLAYITKDEAKMLKKIKKGTPHKGPSGVPSYDDYDASRGDYGTATSGEQMSGMETGSTGRNEQGRADARSLGMTQQDVQDIRSGAIASGAGQRVNPGFFDSRNTVSPDVLARAKAFAPQAYKANRSSGIMDFITSGGILGNVIRGVGQKFGLGKKYNEPTYDMSGSNSLGLHADRFPSGTGIPNFESGDGDYDMLGNKINEITGEITSPTGESLGFVPGYPGSDNSGGITTINRGDGGNNYTQNLVETINETVDDNIPDENLLLRYLGLASIL